MKGRWAIVLCGVLIGVPAIAQENAQNVATLEAVKRELMTVATQTIQKVPQAKLPFSGAVSSSAGGSILTFLAGRVVDKAGYKTLSDALAVSTATQVGSGAEGGGSTSVAMKGLVPALLGFAVEHGAITQNVNKTIATFRVSPAGLLKALQGEGLLDIYQDYASAAGFRFASRFSAAAGFDTSLGDSPGTLLADKQQLKTWSVTITLWNTRDPRAKRYGPMWRELAGQQGQALSDARNKVDGALKSWTTLATWQNALQQRVRTEVDEPWAADGDLRAAQQRFAAILDAELPALSELSNTDPTVTSAMTTYVTVLTSIVTARNDIYKFVNEGAVATFDWTTTRDESLPDLYTLTGVYAGSFTRSRKDDFTFNGALRFYQESPSGTRRSFKDFSATAQWDRPLGKVLEIPFAVTLATRYQYIPEDIPVSGAALIAPTSDTAAPIPSAAPAMGAAIAPKGHLILGQAKLTIPLKNGVKIPLSVSAANRTELIKENDVRVNFGITFNLDAFVAAAKAR